MSESPAIYTTRKAESRAVLCPWREAKSSLYFQCLNVQLRKGPLTSKCFQVEGTRPKFAAEVFGEGFMIEIRVPGYGNFGLI